MKSISSLVKWILFVPASLMSIGLTIFSLTAPEAFASSFSGDRNTVAKIVTFAILILFVVCYVLSLFDKKTSPAHLLKKNYACGVLAIITALAMAAGAAYDVTKMVTFDDIRIMSVVTAILAAVSGIAMLYVGLNHFTGANTPKPIALLYLSLPVWCGAHLIDRFLSHTDTPVAAADTMDLIMFVALSMFFINAMMIHSLIVGKNTVNSTITFGMPAVIASIVYGLINMFSAASASGFVPFDLLSGIIYILLGLYVLSFTIELSFMSKTVNEQVIGEEVDEDKGYSDEYYSDDEEISEDSDVDDSSVDEVVVVVEDEEEFDSESSYVTEAEENTASIEEDDTTPADFNESTDAFVADELLKDAVKNDKSLEAEDSKEDSDVQEEVTEKLQEETETTKKSENENMFFRNKNKEANKIKGPTTREPISYEDDDFILSVNNVESPDPIYDENEDISAFILESNTPNKDGDDRSYVARMDEIDKLIISIQGGDPKKDEE